jgi:hypothetical protein
LQAEGPIPPKTEKEKILCYGDTAQEGGCHGWSRAEDSRALGDKARKVAKDHDKHSGFHFKMGCQQSVQKTDVI